MEEKKQRKGTSKVLNAIFSNCFDTDESMKDIDFDDLQSYDEFSDSFSDGSGS